MHNKSLHTNLAICSFAAQQEWGKFWWQIIYMNVNEVGRLPLQQPPGLFNVQVFPLSRYLFSISWPRDMRCCVRASCYAHRRLIIYTI